MFSIWIKKPGEEDEGLFISDVPSISFAERLAKNLEEEFGVSTRIE